MGHWLYRFFNDLPFLRELFKVLWDKFLIGLLLAYAAFKFSQALEKYRSRQNIVADATKRRIEAAAVVCAALWDYEFAVLQVKDATGAWLRLMGTGEALKSREFYRDILHPLREAAFAKEDAVNAAMKESGFWLGREITERLHRHAASLSEFTHAFPITEDPAQVMDRLSAADATIKASRLDVEAVLQILRDPGS